MPREGFADVKVHGGKAIRRYVSVRGGILEIWEDEHRGSVAVVTLPLDLKCRVKENGTTSLILECKHVPRVGSIEMRCSSASELPLWYAALEESGAWTPPVESQGTGAQLAEDVGSRSIETVVEVEVAQNEQKQHISMPSLSMMGVAPPPGSTYIPPPSFMATNPQMAPTSVPASFSATLPGYPVSSVPFPHGAPLSQGGWSGLNPGMTPVGSMPPPGVSPGMAPMMTSPSYYSSGSPYMQAVPSMQSMPQNGMSYGGDQFGGMQAGGMPPHSGMPFQPPGSQFAGMPQSSGMPYGGTAYFGGSQPYGAMPHAQAGAPYGVIQQPGSMATGSSYGSMPAYGMPQGMSHK